MPQGAPGVLQQPVQTVVEHGRMLGYHRRGPVSSATTARGPRRGRQRFSRTASAQAQSLCGPGDRGTARSEAAQASRAAAQTRGGQTTTSATEVGECRLHFHGLASPCRRTDRGAGASALRQAAFCRWRCVEATSGSKRGRQEFGDGSAELRGQQWQVEQTRIFPSCFISFSGAWYVWFDV